MLITGASYGIGESLAYLLAEGGARLLLVARSEEKLEAVRKKATALGAEVTVFPADLRDKDQLRQLIADLLHLPGGIDIFVSNAGKSIQRPVMESLERFHDFTRTMELNYYAPVQLTLALIPGLKQRNGHIVNVSAINVLLPPVPYWAAYQSSKVAADQWFRSIVPELRQQEIGISLIYLPLVKTRMILPNKSYHGLPAMQPEHVAQIICRSIIRKRAVYRPWWFPPVRIIAGLFPGIWQSVAGRTIRKKKTL